MSIRIQTLEPVRNIKALCGLLTEVNIEFQVGVIPCGYLVFAVDEKDEPIARPIIESYVDIVDVSQEKLRLYQEQFVPVDVALALIAWYEGDPSEVIRLKSIRDRIDALVEAQVKTTVL